MIGSACPYFAIEPAADNEHDPADQDSRPSFPDKCPSGPSQHQKAPLRGRRSMKSCGVVGRAAITRLGRCAYPSVAQESRSSSRFRLAGSTVETLIIVTMLAGLRSSTHEPVEGLFGSPPESAIPSEDIGLRVLAGNGAVHLEGIAFDPVVAQ
jgi:hypothetical protein